MAAEQAYVSNVKEGFRYEFSFENTSFTPDLPTYLEQQRKPLAQFLLESTQGWFSRPITLDWIVPKVAFQLPKFSEGILEGEGTLWLEITNLRITKEKQFVLGFEIAERKVKEKLIIDLEEPVTATEVLEEDCELAQRPVESKTPVNIGPTRRVLQKQRVMEARARAARALFQAERLTQAYCDTYGENTDWEDESESESESEPESESEAVRAPVKVRK